MSDELQQFLDVWERETQSTLKLMRGLPRDQYDFRPDAGGRSMGELAWHLAEVDGIMSNIIDTGRFDFSAKIPGLERPKTVEALAPAFQRAHEDAVARVRKLRPEDLSRTIPFVDGRPKAIRDLLWGAILHHAIHHRGQLSLMCRIAGGTTPGIYGPNREESAAMRAARA